jgi:excisionase family DNA binding protein
MNDIVIAGVTSMWRSGHSGIGRAAAWRRKAALCLAIGVAVLSSLAGVALFRTGLTLETDVTGALNLASAPSSAGRGLSMAADVPPLSDVRFLTVAEVAAIMRVSKMTVYRLVHSGELEAIRVGRSFRVPEQAVNQYLRDAFVGAT